MQISFSCCDLNLLRTPFRIARSISRLGKLHTCNRNCITLLRQSSLRKCRTLVSFLAFANGHVQKESRNFTLDWDPFEDFFGSYPESPRQQVAVRGPDLRSWYGQDGELVRDFPCPSCRGRGYVVCPRCDVGTPEASCQECLGKGLKTCLQCLGERTVWMKSLDEIPWENTQFRSPLQIEDDEIIDRMEIQLTPEKKSKRVYSSPPVEVREKIRHALKTLDARTGSVTRRMRKIHSDPVLNAKRIAAMKKAKCTEAARKNTSEKLHLYFQNPENRFQRSLSLKGVGFHCSYCGGKGHRRHYCPDLPEAEQKKQTLRSYRCSLCGQIGHNRTKCGKLNAAMESTLVKKKDYKCSICKIVGHNARTCQKSLKSEGSKDKGGQEA